MPRKTKDETSKEIEKKPNTVAKTTAKKQTKKVSTTALSKSPSNKKSSSKSTTTTKKKTTSKKVTTTSSKKKVIPKVAEPILEYYDLPYRYNQTIVKILAQTPNSLFVYWDIADEDRKQFETIYGSDFFETTRPVLLVHNETKHYDFEIEINDFANSWYLPIQDVDCHYKIELGRKPISSTTFLQNYISITSSNELKTPNDHILFEKFNSDVCYRNIETQANVVKTFDTFIHRQKMRTISSIHDLYQKLYPDEVFEEIKNTSIPNPSSSVSSTFK